MKAKIGELDNINKYKFSRRYRSELSYRIANLLALPPPLGQSRPLQMQATLLLIADDIRARSPHFCLLHATDPCWS